MVCTSSKCAAALSALADICCRMSAFLVTSIHATRLSFRPEAPRAEFLGASKPKHRSTLPQPPKA